MSTPDPSAGVSDVPRTCSWCGHDNIPNARFCSRCGQALESGEATAPSDPESETTGVFEPVGTTPRSEATWANAEAEQTAALPAAPHVWANTDPAPGTSGPVHQPSPEIPTENRESARGLILGIVALVFMAIVIGYYVYAAWLTQSIRDDILNWIP